MSKITSWLDAHLIYDWRNAWAKWSIKWNVYVGGAAAVWMILPDDTKASILTSIGIPTSWVVVAVAILTVWFRLKRQDPKDGDGGTQ